MEQKIQNKLVAFDGIVIFGADHPVTPPIPRVEALLTQISGVAAALRTHNASQIGGNHEFRSGVSARRLAADALLGQMRPINEIARKLPEVQFPGLRDLFRMPRSDGYATLTGTAQSFIDKVGPVKATFVERGLPADFDEQLGEALAAVIAANTNRVTGKAQQTGGTAGLQAKAQEGMLALHELDAILSYQCRNDPVLLAAWKSTCHVEKDPVYEDEQAPPSGGGSGSGSQPEPTTLVMAEAAYRSANGQGEQAHGGVEPRVNGNNGGVMVG
jgi:hypothetical protein